MHIYKRDISTKLFLFRLVFVMLLSLCLYLFNRGMNDYGFVLSFMLILTTIIPLSEISVSDQFFTIRQYYCFGILHRKWTFRQGDNISLQPIDLEISDAGYLNTDSAWDLVAAAFPIAKLTLQRFVIKSKDLNGDGTHVKMKLSTYEEELIRKNFIN